MEKKKIRIDLPRSWGKLTDKQLLQFFRSLMRYDNFAKIRMAMFLKWAGLRVLGRDGDTVMLRHRRQGTFRVEYDTLFSASRRLAWLDTPPTSPVRPAKIGRRRALDAAFMNVPLSTWLLCDNLYTTWLEEKSAGALSDLVYTLYPGKGAVDMELMKGVALYWMSGLKQHLTAWFPTFFSGSMPDGNEVALQGKSLAQSLMESTNAQIRALTKGDVTKEREVLQLDTWRALTELEALAVEYRTLKEQTK